MSWNTFSKINLLQLEISDELADIRCEIATLTGGT
jgi:hypothetical protein